MKSDDGIRKGIRGRGSSGMRSDEGGDGDGAEGVGESTIELLGRLLLCGKSLVFGRCRERRA